MNAELKRKWIEALRSGEYKQGQSQLRQDDKFCCLGVLCDVDDDSKWIESGPDFEYDGVFFSLSDELLSKFGLSVSQATTLVKLNDGLHSFNYIADYIEENI